ncbi:endonuclease domain-containing protein [Saccharopolyspora mangrovi]|uniref:endonuclease domain-containing protein n=1 Tax=Saccharopolyspora mangrovi TaxID=3082379 RepID=UPI003899AD9A
MDSALKDASCEICDRPVEGREAHFDHDHETNLRRDVLCCSCNLMLGHAHDNIHVLRAGARYILRHRKRAERARGREAP